MVTANEFDEAACDTYEKNRKGVKLIRGDITLPETKDEICKPFKKIPCDVVCGGPPCVAHSPAGRRNSQDPRGRLWRDYMEIVKRLKPGVCVMENVPGICRAREGEKTPVINHILRAFKAAGYRADAAVYISADFGVPQIRKRMIIVASRVDLPLIPAHTTHRKKHMGVMEAIADLMDMEEDKEFCHTFPQLTSDVKERIGKLKQGESLYEYGDGQTRPYGNRPVFSVKASPGGNFVHPERNRLLSPRELARLQCFPDTYRFLGSRTKQMHQVGNAVPVKLAKAVALSVLPLLEFIEFRRNPNEIWDGFKAMLERKKGKA